MPQLTPKGISYPTSSDNIAPLETHLAQLAGTSDNTGVLSGKAGFTGPGSVGATVNVNVTFGLTLKADAVVTCTVKAGAGASSYIATIVSTTPTTFSAKVYRLNGSGADSTLVLHWIASDYE
jgi:hypothetical protein